MLGHPVVETTELVHLRAAGVSVVVDRSGAGLPRVLHWGRDLGVVDHAELAELARGSVSAVVSNSPDEQIPVSVLPELSMAWMGTPGLSGHREGADFSPRFEVDASHLETTPDGGTLLRTAAADEAAGLAMDLLLELTPSGLLRAKAAVTNTGSGRYTVDGLLLAFPVPMHAAEILDFTGRHLRERSPQRHEFTLGSHARDGRRGRTGADASLLLLAGERGFGFRSGEVWGVHPAWSGNHRMLAERTPEGVSLLGAGELLLPGEIRLAEGETYAGPWVYGSYGDGMDELSGRFHDHLRARQHHPALPRPVVANTWEAVYFDQDLDRLTALAQAAADAGAERFVLDDGWFRHRRNDHAGLGDWYVDETVWPRGLGPLVERVRALGMQFGLWVEPEMINPDSDLARAHPEWIMATGGRTPPPSRHQQVLDLANPHAYDHILARLDAVVSEYGVAYLKWDHNRDLIEAGHQPRGQAGVHDQTLAVYRMLAELKARHPGLEIETCSSGGCRVDLGILEHTDRVWTSDCTDALERQQIQRWTGLLVPPEMLGAHISAPVNHSTGRTLSLGMRAATAFFGDLGIEWDLTAATGPERAELATWVSLYKRWRGLLHTGRVVHGDHPDPAVWVNGVVAADRGTALYSVAAMATSVWSPPGRVRLPGLDDHAVYQVVPLPPTDDLGPHGVFAPDWWSTGLRLPGRVLGQVGVVMPLLPPETVALLRVTTASRHGAVPSQPSEEP